MTEYGMNHIWRILKNLPYVGKLLHKYWGIIIVTVACLQAKTQEHYLWLKKSMSQAHKGRAQNTFS